jgi:polynucleotide 5'-kinase involved in rRNA processing
MPSHPHRRLLVPQTDNGDESEEEPREALCRVRSFKTTSKGRIVNRGDSIKRKTQKENLHTNNTLPQDREVRHDTGKKRSSSSEFELVQTQKTQSGNYTAIVLGPAGVGKTLLATQFMTSEYIGTSSEGDGK